MFDQDPAEMDGRSVADLIAATHRQRLQADTHQLVLAGVWGHRHETLDQPADTGAAGSARAVAYGRSTGGAGTPHVSMSAVMELGMLAHTTTTGAANLIADALDLEHRLPILWARVCRGEVEAWRARKVAKDTRHLGLEAAAYVDRSVADYITALPCGRFQSLVDAKIIEADPRQAEARVKAAEAERFVRTGQITEHGLKTIFARVAADDAIWFTAMVDRIATILAEQGDTSLADARRSKAIGILANPPRACQLLADHTTPTDQGQQPVDEVAETPNDDDDDSDTDQDDSDTDDDDSDTDQDHQELVVEPVETPAPSNWDGRPDWTFGNPTRLPNRREPSPPADDDAWPDTDPWLHHAWIGDGLWRAIHHHPNDPGPTEPPPDETEALPAGPRDTPAYPTTSRRSAADPSQVAAALELAANPRLRRRLLPTTVLYVHVQRDVLTGHTPGVARMEGVGPVTLDQLRTFLRSDAVNVKIRPVIDLNQTPAIDCWEVPGWMRERVKLRLPCDVFPYAAGTGHAPDIDHTRRYLPMDRGGPPGQTCETRLGPLSRTHHNGKTHGGFQCRQPLPGVFVWRSPHGHVTIVDADGTHPYGNTTFADQLWKAARTTDHTTTSLMAAMAVAVTTASRATTTHPRLNTAPRIDLAWPKRPCRLAFSAA